MNSAIILILDHIITITIMGMGMTTTAIAMVMDMVYLDLAQSSRMIPVQDLDNAIVNPNTRC